MSADAERKINFIINNSEIVRAIISSRRGKHKIEIVPFGKIYQMHKIQQGTIQIVKSEQRLEPVEYIGIRVAGDNNLR